MPTHNHQEPNNAIEEPEEDLRGLDAIASILGILVVLISGVVLVQLTIPIGPFVALLAVIPITIAYFRNCYPKELLADLIFGATDTGLMVIVALIGSFYFGLAGAIVGAGIGDAITDSVAGFFEGSVASWLREHGIEEARTALKSSMGKMTGCLLGAGFSITLGGLFGLSV